MLARDPDEPHRAASSLELLFDLVFVVAVSQASGALHHLWEEQHFTGGVLTYDEFYVIQGAPDLYDFKLLGKREMLIPYNSYTLNFDVPGQTLMTPAFINPDAVRWELHRVWVVEGTLKPGKRHTVARRLYYIDEDMGGGGMNDGFDASGKLTRCAAVLDRGGAWRGPTVRWLGRLDVLQKRIEWTATILDACRRWRRIADPPALADHKVCVG